MIAILGIEITQFEAFKDESIKMDPIRLVEAVTAGVAFLAAGTILMARGEVHGLTTGAGMWLAAGLGLSCGMGLWQIAIFGAVLALAVLMVVGRMEKKLDIGDPDKKPKPDAKKGN